MCVHFAKASILTLALQADANDDDDGDGEEEDDDGSSSDGAAAEEEKAAKLAMTAAKADRAQAKAEEALALKHAKEQELHRIQREKDEEEVLKEAFKKAKAARMQEIKERTQKRKGGGNTCTRRSRGKETRR